MSPSFTASVCGKTILTGEHTVLRGGEAIVLPVKTKNLELTYKETECELAFSTSGENGPEGEMAILGVLEKALSRVEKRRSDLTGDLHLHNRLQVGVGLGASAALCVSIARFFAFKQWISEGDVFEFARELEDNFHGESSGVDIAVALRSEPILFQREQGAKPLSLSWSPYLFISYSGQRGVTSECVGKVKSLNQKNGDRSKRLDDQMKRATEIAKQALSRPKIEGFPLLVEAIGEAEQCFRGWDLTAGKLDTHMQVITSLGASAVKPTGSGGGGHVLSLFERPVDIRNSDFELTPVFQ